jgi:hypothetical protein
VSSDIITINKPRTHQKCHLSGGQQLMQCQNGQVFQFCDPWGDGGCCMNLGSKGLAAEIWIRWKIEVNLMVDIKTVCRAGLNRST